MHLTALSSSESVATPFRPSPFGSPLRTQINSRNTNTNSRGKVKGLARRWFPLVIVLQCPRNEICTIFDHDETSGASVQLGTGRREIRVRGLYSVDYW